jgi:hypothetical protein
MDVFVALLLLFGGFSLGVATGGDVKHLPSATLTPMTERHAVPGQADYAHLHDCLTNRHGVIYRDLSRAHPIEVDIESPKPGDCDGACPDE